MRQLKLRLRHLNHAKKKLLCAIAAFLIITNVSATGTKDGVAATANSSTTTMADITGLVTDSLGNPIPGVTVQVKGSGKITTSNNDGVFSLADVASDAVLVFSFVGYETLEYPISGRTEINVVMSGSSQLMSEVVVMGYGTQQKRLVTGATVEIKSADIQKRSAISPLAAIQGQSPGVSLTSTGGQPGNRGFRINIRGAGTVGETTPLFIVDGVQTSDISFLNNADIASIDILKDAASAAIYGARAANGIIFITTKSGTAGSAKISFDGFYGIQNVAKKLNVLNGRDYINMINEMHTNSNMTPVYNDEALNEQLLRDVNGGTDWMDLLLAKNVPTQNYSLGAQGGSDKSVYAFSLSQTMQGGIVGGADLSNFKRTTFRINTEHRLYKDVVKIGQHLTYGHTENIGASYPVSGAIRTPPIIPNMHPEHPQRYYYNDVPATGGDNIHGIWSTEITNPYASMVYSSYSLNKVNKVLGDAYMEIKLLKNLKFKTILTLDYTTERTRSYQPLRPNLSASVNKNTGTTQTSQYSMENMMVGSENILSYAEDFGSHRIDALAGMSALRTRAEYLNASNRNLLYDGFDYAWLNNATGNASAGTMSMSGYPSEDALLSYFGRVNYNYKGTYMASVIFRSDGSSRFDKSHRRGYFPSFSAGWILSNENFMQNLDWVSFLKLRASWGQNGNMNIPPYYYLALVGSNYPYAFGGNGNNAVGASLINLGNPSLNWEKAQSANIGFDAQLLQGKLGITVDWYNRQTRDWLVRANVPTIYGVQGPYINGGNVVNKGVEILVNYSDVIGKDFSYTLSGNIAFNRNKVSNIPTQNGILHGGGGTLYANSVEVTRSQNGFPLGFFWGLTTDGIFQTTDEIESYKGTGGNLIQPNARPGDLRYVDRNGDGIISDLDKTMIGSGHPDAIFGLNTSFNYKGFDLYIAANGVLGNQILQNYIDANRNYWNITQDLYDDRWHGPGTSNKYPRVDAQNTNWINFSDVFLYRGDYLRINNLSLGYDFCKSVLKLKNLSQFRIYITAQNLYTFTSYNGMDPEVGTGSNGVDQSEVGRDWGMYPTSRTFLFGVNLKF